MTSYDISLTTLNAADDRAATALILPLIERSPQIAERVATHRPFYGPEARLASTREREVTTALNEIVSVSQARTLAALGRTATEDAS